MNASTPSRFAGIDVSANTAHSPAGHAACAKLLSRPGHTTRGVVEATSVYHLDLCITLATAPHCEVMVVNPLATHAVTQAQGRRANTEATEAVVLQEFARAMPLVDGQGWGYAVPPR